MEGHQGHRLPALPGTGLAIHLSAMKSILLCSSNPLLTKNLYAVLRDEGYAVETVEHPALAVQMVMAGSFDIMIVDSEPFGLSAEDAAQIIRSLKPDFPILSVGNECGMVPGVEKPLDLEEFKRTVHAIAVC